MNRFKRKLILSIFMLAITVITLTSTTYAWFASNREAWTEEFELDIQNTDGLLISVDGEHFMTEVSKEDIIKAIAAKRLNKTIDALTESEIESPKLSSVTTSDLVQFTTIDSTSSHKDGFYEYHHASEDSYIVFDLWFKAESSKGIANKSYDLSFVNSEDGVPLSYIDAEECEVTLSNALTTPFGSYGPNTENKTIKVNPKNAMRIGVMHNNEPTIYEPYEGLGSYAIAGEEEAKYNPDMNAMLTHFNNSHNIKLAPLEANEVYKNTEKDFERSISFGTITPNELNTEYQPIKITVYIWLEGMDADYFMGVSTKQIKVFLNFTMKEVN